MSADVSGENGRVTLALIGQKLDTVLMNQSEYIACQKEHDRRISLLERGFDARSERVKAIEDDIAQNEKNIEKVADDVKYIGRQDKFGSIGAAIGVIIATILGIFVKP